MFSKLFVYTSCLSGLALCTFAGCGEGFEKPVMPVQGTVKIEGKLATEGYVLFSPVLVSGSDPLQSGKASTGTIKSDGTFELTTYTSGDGAVVGKHRVTFYKPDPEDDEQLVRDPHLPGGSGVDVEVLAEGNNVIEFNLKRRGPPDVSRQD